MNMTTGARKVRDRILIAVLVGWACLIQAAPMDGEPVSFTQPDGAVLQLLVYGDEFYAETRTLDDYTVYFDTAVKAYFYAVLSTDGNELVSSGVLVGSGPPPAGLPKKLTINKNSKREKVRKNRAADESEVERAKRWESIKEKNREKREKKNKKQEQEAESTHSSSAPADGIGVSASSAPAPPSNETTGTRIGLTIMVEFPDVSGAISRQEVDDYCNKTGYSGYSNNGSVLDFFMTQSSGKLRYYNVVTPYVMAPHPKSYYNDTTKSSGYSGRLLLNDVLQVLMDAGFDFSQCTLCGNQQWSLGERFVADEDKFVSRCGRRRRYLCQRISDNQSRDIVEAWNLLPRKRPFVVQLS
jgi:hypothetical protein